MSPSTLLDEVEVAYEENFRLIMEWLPVFEALFLSEYSEIVEMFGRYGIDVRSHISGSRRSGTDQSRLTT